MDVAPESGIASDGWDAQRVPCRLIALPVHSEGITSSTGAAASAFNAAIALFINVSSAPRNTSCHRNPSVETKMIFRVLGVRAVAVNARRRSVRIRSDG
jgi:hypothetical protein